MMKAPTLLLMSMSIFAHAQTPLPSLDQAELSKEQLKHVQQAVSAARSTAQDTLKSDAWKNIEKELSSEQWAKKQASYKTQFEAMFQSPPGPGKDKSATEDGPKLVGNQLVLFVSSSMPLPTLRAYARDLAQVGGVMAIRGGVGGLKEIQPTLSLIQSILSVKAGCQGVCKMWGTEIVIDPMLFRLYGVNKVPALIYQPDMKIAAYCDGLEQVQKASGIVYGDASLMGMLDELYKETPDDTVKKLRDTLWKKQ